MASAPAVANLQDLVSQYTTAQQPQSDAIDNSIAANDASGATQIQGINDAENTAFQGINTKANSNGMYFSGYTPSSEATYVGGTYLPALANLQTSIANTKNTLLGQKAALQTSANTDALTEQEAEQKALDDWNTQQATDENTTAIDNADNANKVTTQQMQDNTSTANANTANAKNVVSPDSAAQQIIAASRGSDGYVSPSTFELARKAYVTAGGSASDFAKDYWSFTGAGTGQPNQSNWQAYYYG